MTTRTAGSVNTSIIKGLLVNGEPFNFCGQFYRIRISVMRPALPREQMPELFISGTAEARARHNSWTQSRSSTRSHPRSTKTRNGRARQEYVSGFIAADDSELAWERAYQRFPGDSVGRIKHVAAMRISDSQWHKNLARRAREVMLEISR